jgi:hypothetical protein
LPIAPGTDTAPQAAHSPNILNLRRLFGDRRLARRLQADRCPLAFKDRAVPSIASDVNSTSSFAQSASQQRPSAVPTPQQTDSQPFTALLDAVSSQQQTGAQANPSPPPPQCRQAALRGSRAAASSRITIRNRARPERTAAIRRPRKRHRARRANSRQIPTRRPRPLPTTASLRRKTARRPTPRTRPIPIRLRNRTRQIRMRWGRPPIPAKSRHLRQPTIPRNNRQATRKAKTMPRRPTPRQRPQRRQTRPIQRSNRSRWQSSSTTSRPPRRRAEHPPRPSAT